MKRYRTVWGYQKGNQNRKSKDRQYNGCLGKKGRAL
jgi:hypothetical protein